MENTHWQMRIDRQHCTHIPSTLKLQRVPTSIVSNNLIRSRKWFYSYMHYTQKLQAGWTLLLASLHRLIWAFKVNGFWYCLTWLSSSCRRRRLSISLDQTAHSGTKEYSFSHRSLLLSPFSNRAFPVLSCLSSISVFFFTVVVSNDCALECFVELVVAITKAANDVTLLIKHLCLNVSPFSCTRNICCGNMFLSFARNILFSSRNVSCSRKRRKTGDPLARVWTDKCNKSALLTGFPSFNGFVTDCRSRFRSWSWCLLEGRMECSRWKPCVGFLDWRHHYV